MVSAVPAGEVMARDGGLGEGDAVGGDDGHDDHAGAIARDAADAVLVRHQGLAPVELLAAVDHGPRQGQDLVALQPDLGAGDHEGGHLDLGIAVGDDVPGDGGVLRCLQALAVDLAMHRGSGTPVAGRGRCVPGPRPAPSWAKACSDSPNSSGAVDAAIVHHVQDRQDPTDPLRRRRSPPC